MKIYNKIDLLEQKYIISNKIEIEKLNKRRVDIIFKSTNTFTQYNMTIKDKDIMKQTILSLLNAKQSLQII